LKRRGARTEGYRTKKKEARNTTTEICLKKEV